MSEHRLELIIAGADASAAADDLAQLIEGAEIVDPAWASDDAKKKLDAATAIAIATLILTIPGAVLATMDIADRIEKRTRAEQLLEQAKEIQVTRTVEIQIVTPDGAKPLDGLSPDDLLDLAERLSAD